MNKAEALEEMKLGKKLTHNYFSRDEWITAHPDGFIFEDGNICTSDEFWNNRKGHDWELGWSIWINRGAK